MSRDVQVPASWFDPLRLFAAVELEVNVIQCLVIHGLILHALKDQVIPQTNRVVGEQLLDYLERIFFQHGLDEPEEGWRAFMPVKQ